MTLGTCSVCAENPANYKCPQCLILYCSLPCYKNPKHVHGDQELVVKPQVPQELPVPKEDSQESARENLFARIAGDTQIKALLATKLLQVHLAVVLKLLEDTLLTDEAMAENRREIANMRLCDLRMGGSCENILVEEFVVRILELYGAET